MLYRNFGVAAGVIALSAVVVALIAFRSDDPTGTSAGALVQGDTDCSQEVGELDSLEVLSAEAGIEPPADCIEAGDVDCDGDVAADDSLAILVHVAGFTAAQISSVCTAIGEPLTSITPTDPGTTVTATPSVTTTPPPTAITITPTPVPTPTPPPPCAGPGGGPSLPSDPGGSATPQADAYQLDTLLSAGYLGDAADPAIDLALMPGHPNVGILITQDGYLYRVALDGSVGIQLWGDIDDRVQSGGEQGLLAIAFSPDFVHDCRVYVYYTRGAPQPASLSRFTALPGGLDESSEEPLFDVGLNPERSDGNHNGGDLAFDSDGLLYLSSGDGGGQNDPDDRVQELNRTEGKVLRFDVSGATVYQVPAGNPFADGPGGNVDEIFALGFRNPFRFSIDPVSDKLWLGDVGGGLWEEVNLVQEGGNYGWDCYEGPNQNQFTPEKCDQGPFLLPYAQYNHDFGQAITGGVVYRGDDMPELYGWYIYADFYSGRIWAVNTEGSGGPAQLLNLGGNGNEPAGIASFTLGLDGEVYVVDYSDGIYKLAR
jgi:glucose/arabinose dehydrogenase